MSLTGDRLIDLKTRLLILFFFVPLFLLPLVGVAAAFTVSTLQATTTTAVGPYDKMGIAIGAGLAIGLSALGAGLAISAVGSAAISALAEKPDTFFRSFLMDSMRPGGRKLAQERRQRS